MDIVNNLWKLARALDYARDPDPKHWKTINGSHVYLDGNGNYDGGAGSKFNGRHHYGSGWKEKTSLMNRLAAALQAHECYQHVRDSWEEDKHPRDEGGRFTSGGSRKRTRKDKNRVVKLPKREYALVMHELNTNVSGKQRKQKIIQKPIGNYLYVVRNNGFNDYVIIRKIPLD